MMVSSLSVFSQWAQLPKEGGEIRDLVTTPGGILVATDGGVFKSTNTGLTWAYSSNGLFAADSSIACIKFAKTSTAYFVATRNGIAKTTDNGANWSSTGNTGFPTTNGYFTGLVSVSNKLYTCRYTNMNAYEIYTSTDDGATWTPGAFVYSNGNQPELFNVLGTVYVTKADSVFTTATGASLTPVSNTGMPVTGSSLGHLSGDGTYVYAGFTNGGSGLLRYDLGSTTWQNIGTTLPPYIFTSGPFLMGPTLVASILTTSMTLQTYTSSTQGTSWNQITLNGMSKDFVQEIYSLGGSNILVYNPVDQINISNDNGANWAQHITGFKADSYRDQKSLTFSNGNLISTEDLGIIRSSNGGMTWTPAVTGIPSTLYFNFNVYNANNTVYTTFRDIAGSYLYKSMDGAVTWTAATLPAGVTDFEFWGHSNTALFIKDGNNLYRSTDAGASWTDITANLNSSYNYNTPIVTSGVNIGIVGSNGSGYQLFSSNNDGTSWSNINMTGLPVPNASIADNMFVKGGVLMSMWLDYSVMPWTYKMASYTGSNWTTVTVNGLPQGLVNTCMSCSNNGNYEAKWFSEGSNLFFMSMRGLFISTDDGANFAPYNNGFYPGVNVSRMAYDGTTLFAGTEGNSIWSVSAPLKVSSLNKSEGMDVYPNPAVNQVMITCDKDFTDTNGKIVITDMLGSVVQEVSLVKGSTQTELSTSSLKSGIYFYTLISDKKTITKKVVISK